MRVTIYGLFSFVHVVLLDKIPLTLVATLASVGDGSGTNAGLGGSGVGDSIAVGVGAKVGVKVWVGDVLVAGIGADCGDDVGLETGVDITGVIGSSGAIVGFGVSVVGEALVQPPKSISKINKERIMENVFNNRTI